MMAWIISYCQDILVDPCMQCTEEEMLKAMSSVYRM